MLRSINLLTAFSAGRRTTSLPTLLRGVNSSGPGRSLRHPGAYHGVSQKHPPPTLTPPTHTAPPRLFCIRFKLGSTCFLTGLGQLSGRQSTHQSISAMASVTAGNREVNALPQVSSSHLISSLTLVNDLEPFLMQIVWQPKRNIEVLPASGEAGAWVGDLLVYGVPEDSFETTGMHHTHTVLDLPMQRSIPNSLFK